MYGGVPREMNISLHCKDTRAAQGTLGRTSAGPSSFTVQTARNMVLDDSQDHLSLAQPPRGRPCGPQLME